MTTASFRRWLGVVAWILLCSGPAIAALAAEAAAPAGDANAVASGNNQFALDLYSTASAGGSGNLIFSPYSISSALAMTSVGARSKTLAEFMQVLHADFPSPAAFNDSEAAMLRHLQDSQKQGVYQLQIANRLWGATDFTVLEAFQKTVQSVYGADLKQLDFSHTNQAVQAINDWAEQNTKGKIKNILDPQTLRPDTKLVLTNAVYFNGNWAEQFKKQDTQNDSFTLVTKEKVNAPLMHKTDVCRIALAQLPSGEAFKVLELPYKGRALSLVALLPDEPADLPRLESALNIANLTSWLAAMKRNEVIITLPAFKLQGEFQLKDALAKQGLSTAFSQAADFSGIDGKNDLLLSAVVHKAYIDVNETGTEAAAVTSVVVAPMAAPANPKPKPPPIYFTADHPFVFLIRDSKTGCILFLGRLMDPRP